MINPYYVSVACCLLLLGLMPAASLAGHRFGRRRLLAAEGQDLATGAVDAAVFSLLGLLTAFSFSGAYTRYEARRELIVQEVNAIGTAYLRLDLLPAEPRARLQSRFRDYVDARLNLWTILPDYEAARAELARTATIQQEIWSATMAATQEEPGDARKLLVPALNDMIDITTTRWAVIEAHPPLVVFLMLGVLAVAAAWVHGFDMHKSPRPSYVHMAAFAVITVISIYVTLDIEFPRFGLVTLDASHRMFVDLKDSMR